MSADHNVALFPYNGQGLNYNLPMGATMRGGTVQTRLSTGLDAYGNLSFGTPLNLSIRVQDVEPVDWHLRSAPARRLARAIGRGDACATDITGAARMSPPTVGADRLPKSRLLARARPPASATGTWGNDTINATALATTADTAGGPQPPRRLMLSPWLPEKGLACDPAWKIDPLRRGIGVQN